MKWSKSGFAAIGDRKETPRNLFGFKDGTANVTTEKEFDKVVWTDSKDWMKGGSYMALRLVQMHLRNLGSYQLAGTGKHLWSLQGIRRTFW
ncbi:MAG: hypothetical protein ACLTYH_09250 [Streptococcus salivarius]